MNICAFSECENALTNKCSGEVKVLMQAAERYGVMAEEARKRIEEICLYCENRFSLEKNEVNARVNRHGYDSRFSVGKREGPLARRTQFTVH